MQMQMQWEQSQTIRRNLGWSKEFMKKVKTSNVVPESGVF